jgi:hypothetical protein
MRILSLGVPLPGPCIDNHSFADAPAFFDYDAIIADPLVLSRLIEGVANGNEQHAARSGERIFNGPSGHGQIDLADLLRARRDETARLLARGGIVVCFAQPNVVHERVAGLPGCDRYCWLPTPHGVRYDEPFLRRGEGTHIEAVPSDHPFEPLLVSFARRLAYHACFADETAGTVLARSAGGAAVALDVRLGGGSIVFLPPLSREPSAEERYELSDALQEAIRQTLRLASASGAPYWVADYESHPASLPGLTEAKTGAADTDLQRLLWQEGRYGFEEAVRAALALLGFTVTAGLEEPAVISMRDDRGNLRSAMLEVDASEGAVGLGGHHRLRQRIEAAIVRRKPAQGLLVINGYRRTPPPERPAQHEEPLRVAAERFRYCVATTVQLFHAARAALAGDDATVAAFRERLLTTEGVLHDD